MRECQTEAKEQPNQLKTIWQELEAWGHAFKPWQKFILGHAVRIGRLNEEQINQAYTLFLQNNELAETTEPPVEVLPITGRPASATQNTLQLAGMGNLCAINALPPSAELSFPSQLTVIYGGNGTGKSGFVRVLSKACFSRDQRDILPNIYDENPPKQSARLNIISGGKCLPEIIFDASTEHLELKRISVFNTSVASSLLTEQNPLCFKPAGFDVFPEMARVYEQLTARLNTDIAQKSQENKFVKSFLTPASPISELIKALSADTDMDNLRSLAVYGEAELARYEEIQRQIDDLKAKSVTDKIKQLEEAKRDLVGLESQLTLSLVLLREAKRVEYRNKIADHAAKTKAAAEYGAETFRQSFFSRTGTPEWGRFVEAAYALGKAEHEHYPRDEDYCLLCQRPLDTSSKQFIERLWDFLLANAQREEKEAKMYLVELAQSLQANNLNFFTDESRVHGYLTRLNTPLAKAVGELLQKAQQEQTEIINALNGSAKAIPTDTFADMTTPLQTLVQQIEADITTLRQSNVDEALKKLDAERIVLRHRQLLNQLLSDIENFVTDAIWAKKASVMPKRSLNPKPVTEKENELFSTLIADDYRQRLMEECIALDCKLPVEFRAKGQRGQTVRSLEMKGHSPEKVLSEGEQRAVALADFLTEVALNSAGAGIILDDPVNSQDHERKEKIAQRLVKEANTRQGYYNGAKAPFGYKTTDAGQTGTRGRMKKKLAIEPAEAEIVHEIFDLYVDGKNNLPRMGMKEIAKTLNQRGLLMRGKLWRVQKICNVLSSPTYAGTLVFNRENSKTRQVKDESEWVKVGVPAIVSQEQFDKAAKLRDAFTPMKCSPRRETSPNLLTGFLKCDCCGSTMVAVTSGKGEQYRYYKCSNRVSKGNTACKSTAYRMDALDALILDAFRQKIYTPKYIRDIIDDLRKHTNQHGSEDKQRTRKLEAELKELEQAENKLFEAIEKGVLELDDRLKARRQQHKTRMEAITVELASIQHKQKTPLQTLTPQRIEAVARTINKRFSVSTPFSRAYLRATVREIRVMGDYLKLTGENKAIANLVAANGQIEPTEKVRRFMPVWRPLRDSNPCCRRERAMS